MSWTVGKKCFSLQQHLLTCPKTLIDIGLQAIYFALVRIKA
jgi:hypothetical protein